MLSRMKFEIEPLVAEMLDQLPADVWTSTSSTFFDPAIGGGQFVRAIESRLRAAGHSDSNIRKRVFGFEASDLHIRFAVNKHGLVGQYVKKPYDKFLELDDTMKFDVVVGNPPYQAVDDEGERKDPGSNLWTQFFIKGYQLTKDQGFLAMVSPDAWVTPYSENTIGGRKNGREVRKIFRENQIIWLNYRECGKHFPKVGSAFTSYVINKTTTTADTAMVLIENNNLVTQSINLKNFFWLPKTPSKIVISIIEKVFWKTSNYNLLSGCGASGNQSSTKDQTYKYPFYVAFSTIKYSDTNHPHQHKKKVIFPALNTKELAIYDSGTHGPVLNGINIEVSSDQEGENLLSILHSKVIQFCLNQSRWHHGYQMTYVLQNIPAVDFTKTWSDQDLYAYFGLTQEEIDYIENAVK